MFLANAGVGLLAPILLPQNTTKNSALMQSLVVWRSFRPLFLAFVLVQAIHLPRALERRLPRPPQPPPGLLPCQLCLGSTTVCNCQLVLQLPDSLA